MSEQFLPYWHQSRALDAQLAQIITELQQFLDEYPEDQPYPWRHSGDQGEIGDKAEEGA